jgi:hypothetical protein
VGTGRELRQLVGSAQSANPVGKSGIYGGTGMQRSQHGDGSNRRAGKLRSDIPGNAGEPQHTDMDHLAGGKSRLQIFSAEMTQPKLHLLAPNRLLDGIGMPLELVSDGGPDKVGSVRVEPFLNHQIDMTEIDMPEIYRDLFALPGPPSKLVGI